jgi:ABC-type xylose transport system substrate-binding protein
MWSTTRHVVRLRWDGGSPDDNNAYFFYNGAMSVLINRK